MSGPHAQKSIKLIQKQSDLPVLDEILSGWDSSSGLGYPDPAGITQKSIASWDTIVSHWSGLALLAKVFL
jgi:hypothetical protein